MKRVLVAVTLMVVLGLQGVTPVDASDWSRVVKRLQASTVAVSCSLHAQNTCTAFSINSDQGLYMTAAHCVPGSYASEGEPADEPRIDGQPLTVLYLSQELDLAIVQAKTKRPALAPRLTPLLVGNELGAYGYGYGGKAPLFRTATVSVFLPDELGNEWMMFDSALIGGMSGGPIVDRDGRVVGINVKSDGLSGISLSIGQILRATQFWGQ